MAQTTCTPLQKSFAWCEGTPSYAGLRRKIYYVSKSNIVKWPTLTRDDNGRVTAAKYTGNFELAEAAKFASIELDPSKSEFTSEPQGELPSQTQLNKLTAVLPAINEEATDLNSSNNNSDNVYIFQDMKGNYRVLGGELWPTKSAFAQASGQGATGNATTTLTVEASDEVAFPFYTGTIDAEDGTINPAL